MRKFLTYHLPALLYAGLIIAVSSIPHLKTPKVIFLQFDKVIHFVEYALLALLAYRSTTHLTSNISRHTAFLLSALFVAIFATLDELYQRTVPGRYSALGDLLVDLAGAALVLILLWYRGRAVNSNRIQAKQ